MEEKMKMGVPTYSAWKIQVNCSYTWNVKKMKEHREHLMKEIKRLKTEIKKKREEIKNNKSVKREDKSWVSYKLWVERQREYAKERGYEFVEPYNDFNLPKGDK